MANLIENNQIFYTPYEPKVQNRFILQIDGIPSFMVKTANRPKIEVPLLIPSKLNGSGTVPLNIIVENKLLKLFIGGAEIVSTITQASDMAIEGLTNYTLLSEFNKFGTGGICVLGVVPKLGDFENIWYLRAVTIGRLIFLL